MINIKLLLLLCVFILCAFLFGCTADPQEDDILSHSISMRLLDGINVNDDGIVYVEDNVLRFYDFESEQHVVLSNRPDCLNSISSSGEEEDSPCNAILPPEDEYTVSVIGLHQGNVFLFVQEGMQTVVYKQNPAGDGRTKLSEFDWQVSTAVQTKIHFIGDHAYFIGEAMIKEEYEDGEMGGTSANVKVVMLRLDLDTGEVEQLSEIRHDFHSLIMFYTLHEDKIFYLYQYFDEEIDLQTEEGLDNMNNYIHLYVYEIDLDTKEERLVLDAMDYGGVSHIINLVEDRILFTSEDYSSVFEVNLETKEKQDLFEDEKIENTAILPNGILYSKMESENNAWNFYNFETKEIKDVVRQSGQSTPLMFYKDLLVVISQLSEGEEFKLVLISEVDYLEGKENYIILEY